MRGPLRPSAFFICGTGFPACVLETQWPYRKGRRGLVFSLKGWDSIAPGNARGTCLVAFQAEGLAHVGLSQAYSLEAIPERTPGVARAMLPQPFRLKTKPYRSFQRTAQA